MESQHKFQCNDAQLMAFHAFVGKKLLNFILKMLWRIFCFYSGKYPNALSITETEKISILVIENITLVWNRFLYFFQNSPNNLFNRMKGEMKDIMIESVPSYWARTRALWLLVFSILQWIISWTKIRNNFD